MDSIRIALFDDQPVFINGLKICLRADPRFNIMMESPEINNLLQQLEKTTVDIVLMNLEMFDIDGLTALCHIRDLFTDIKILGLSNIKDENFICNVIRSGANGYLLKTARPEEIIQAISDIHQSGFSFNPYFSLSVLKRCLQTDQFNTSSRHVLLSGREQEILKLVCREHSNMEIAKKLYVSKRTVEGYRSKLLEKCKVRSVAGLVLYAVKSGILIG